MTKELSILPTKEVTLRVNSPFSREPLKLDGPRLPNTETRWSCSITPDDDHAVLRISVPYCYVKNKTKYELRPLLGVEVRSLRVLPQNERVPVELPVKLAGDNFTSKVPLGILVCEGLYFFDLLLSSAEPRPQKSLAIPSGIPKRNHSTLEALLGDITTMDVVFTFGADGSKRSLGVWAHQSVLTRHLAFARYLEKVANIECYPGETLKQVHIFSFTWQAFGCALRYLYTGDIGIEIDPSLLALSAAPASKSEILKARVKVSHTPAVPANIGKAAEGDAVGESSSLSTSSSVESLSTTATSMSLGSEADRESQPQPFIQSTWEDLFEVAACYEIEDLRKYCLEKILLSLTPKNVLGKLFRVGNRYEDLKDPLVKYVVDFLPNVFSGEENPFEPFVEHPTCCAIMADVMRIKASRG